MLKNWGPEIIPHPCGDYNVMPTELDVYKPQKYINDALFREEVRDAYQRLLKLGWTDAHQEIVSKGHDYTFWDYFRNAWARMPVYGLTISSLPAPGKTPSRRWGGQIRSWLGKIKRSCDRLD
jgi:exonuclease III